MKLITLVTQRASKKEQYKRASTIRTLFKAETRRSRALASGTSMPAHGVWAVSHRMVLVWNDDSEKLFSFERILFGLFCLRSA